MIIDVDTILIQADITLEISDTGRISENNMLALSTLRDKLSVNDWEELKNNILTQISSYYVTEGKDISLIKSEITPIITQIASVFRFNAEFTINFMSIQRELENVKIDLSQKILLLENCIQPSMDIKNDENEIICYKQLLSLYLNSPRDNILKIKECAEILKTKVASRGY